MEGFSIKYLILGLFFIFIGPFFVRNSLKKLKKFDGWYSESVKVGEFGCGIICSLAGAYLIFKQFSALID